MTNERPCDTEDPTPVVSPKVVDLTAERLKRDLAREFRSPVPKGPTDAA